MAEQPPYPDSDGETGAGTGPAPTAGTPRWVKVLGGIALVLLLMFVILHLTFGGLGGHAP